MFRDQMHVDHDPFLDATGRARRLWGVSLYSASTRLAEMAARVGFDVVWIEMEHGPADFTLVESICTAAEAGGALAAVRVPDFQRHHILRALEVGARFVVVPMINTAQQAQQIVEHGKFPPIGSRGFNLRTRGLDYGLNREQLFERANARTALIAQIETRQAVENLDAICAVPGLAGILIGPGDLSVSLGFPGDMNNATFATIVGDCIRRARAAGKHAGILINPGKTLDAAVAAGADLIFCGGDISDLSVVWTRLLADCKTKWASPVDARQGAGISIGNEVRP